MKYLIPQFSLCYYENIKKTLSFNLLSPKCAPFIETSNAFKLYAFVLSLGRLLMPLMFMQKECFVHINPNICGWWGGGVEVQN